MEELKIQEEGGKERRGGERRKILSYTLGDFYFLTQNFTHKLVFKNVLAKLPTLSTYVTHSTALKK